MTKWFASLLLIFGFASGVFAVVPGHAGNGRMMKCCDKAKSKDHTPEIKAAQLCCIFNCNSSVPTSSSASFNFSPSASIIGDSIIKQIASLLEKEEAIEIVSYQFEREMFPQKFQPKYIQHHSFLI